MKIQLDKIKEFLGCDDAFLVHLLRKFIEESDDCMALLKNASDRRNWPVVKGTAHKMLSSTRIFNFDELSLLLEDIEIIADEGTNTDQLPGKVSAVELALKNAVEAIRPLLQKPQP